MGGTYVPPTEEYVDMDNVANVVILLSLFQFSLGFLVGVFTTRSGNNKKPNPYIVTYYTEEDIKDKNERILLDRS